ncbi:mitochondrial ribonuclease P catalytic subunit [Cloeon dipterum]|uniref:mitochondrial ribonuclease P catalytic subunit n=1 Tax=Cloeon dipterum TaxID=197152 RepID=UPI00321FA81D
MNFGWRTASRIPFTLRLLTRLSANPKYQLRSCTGKSQAENLEDFEIDESTANLEPPGHSRTLFAMNFLQSKIQERRPKENKEWDEILEKTLELPNYSSNINKVSINGVVMTLCLQEKNFDLALQFLKYLEDKGEEINHGTLSVFMKLCYSCWPDSSEEIILKYYDILRKRLTIIDTFTAENCTLAISLTSRWMEYTELLEHVKLSGSIGRNLYTVLVSTAFRNKQPNLGWSLLHQAATEGKTVTSAAYSAWFEYCAENNPTVQGAETLLKFSHEWNIGLDEVTADDIQQYFEQIVKPAWKVEHTSIKHSGTCMACRRKLPTIFITKEEFKKLSESFLEKVVIGKDVFTKSTPEEVNRFSQFLDRSLPYDVVIDGLNVALALGSRSSVAPIDFLIDVVNYFLDRDMKIMIIGRIHMLKWPKQKFDYIQKNCKVFLAQNISQDDPLLLYAAMRGGLSTYFVSRDFMRGHKHRLQDFEMQQLFRRWQLARQYSAFASAAKRKSLVFPPSSYLPFAQKTGDSWHVPYSEDKPEGVAPLFHTPKNWLCIKK